MVKLFLLLLLTLFRFNSLCGQESDNQKEYIFKAGDILEYEVNKGGRIYQLTVTLTGKTFIDNKIVNDITFDWVSSEDKNRKGSVTITKEARTNATTYQPYLLPGEITLKNKCSLWLSYIDLHSFFSPEGREMDLGDGSKRQYKIVEGGGEKYSFISKENRRIYLHSRQNQRQVIF